MEENTLSISSIYSIGYNIAAWLGFMILLAIIEFSKKHTREQKTVLMPIDNNRVFIASIFYAISGLYLTVSLISFNQEDFASGAIGLVNTAIWAWFPTLSFKEVGQNQYGESRSNATNKPSRSVTEGIHLCFILFYDFITTDEHDEDHITDQKTDHTCMVDNLKGSDDWLFTLKVIFPYKWDPKRILDIRGFKGGSGGQDGIIEHACEILINACQDIDDSYKLEEIDKKEDEKQNFKDEIIDTFTERIEHSGLPLKIIKGELFTISVIFSKEYLDSMQKKKTAEKEGEARKTLTLSEQQIVLTMMTDAQKAGVHEPYEYWLDQYQRSQDQAGTKYKFEGIDTKKINPVINLTPKAKK